MADLGAAAALVLAATFAVAGLAKARGPALTAATFRALGLPVPAALARAVPLAELGLAVALVAWPRAGGLAALVALAAFSAVLARVIRRGHEVACGCFGGTGRHPVGPLDLARNALLAVAALAATAAGGPAVPTLPALLAASTAALIGLVVLALARVPALEAP